MIKKQGDLWLCDIQPGGRNHKRYRKLFKTKSQAKAFQVKLDNQVQMDDSFKLKKKDNRTLSDLINVWFDLSGKYLYSGSDSRNRMLKASTVMGNPVVSFFSPSLFLGNRSKRINDGIKPATLNRELSTFKAVFNELIRSNIYAGTNPFKHIRLIKTHQPKTVFLSVEEINVLFSFLKKSDSDAYLIAFVCLSTGSRWSEAQKLKLSDITDGMVHYHETKSKKSRSVPLTNFLYELLRVRLKRSSFSDSYSTFTRRLYESGIELPKGQRTHILRHTFASHFIMNGGNILSLQKILGHSSLNMTMRYAHLAPDYLREILEKNPALSLC